LRLCEDPDVLLKEAIKQLSARVHGCQGRDGRRGWCRCGAHAAPQDAASSTGEGGRLGVEIPCDGAQGAQEVDAEDEVEAAQVDADAGDVVLFTRDQHRDIARDPHTA
jgi:hypothetical protein